MVADESRRNWLCRVIHRASLICSIISTGSRMIMTEAGAVRLAPEIGQVIAAR